MHFLSFSLLINPWFYSFIVLYTVIYLIYLRQHLIFNKLDHVLKDSQIGTFSSALSIALIFLINFIFSGATYNLVSVIVSCYIWAFIIGLLLASYNVYKECINISQEPNLEDKLLIFLTTFTNWPILIISKIFFFIIDFEEYLNVFKNNLHINNLYNRFVMSFRDNKEGVTPEKDQNIIQALKNLRSCFPSLEVILIGRNTYEVSIDESEDDAQAFLSKVYGLISGGELPSQSIKIYNNKFSIISLTNLTKFED